MDDMLNSLASEVITFPESGVTCANCEASCCRLEVRLISDTGVPDHLIEANKWGEMSMARLDDGWCAALDRNTMQCKIYQYRPLICRMLAMGSYECLSERAAHQ
jgi:Fe-S-cluster containining protein